VQTKKVNILVVDDRVESILAVSAVLDSTEYNIVSASSGSEALKQLLKDDFAVILLDVQMPIMNGFETAAIIKTREKSQDIPIIFMSAINQDEQYVYQGYEVGAVDYLLKPFDPYILRSKVAIFVDIFKKKDLIKEQIQKLHEIEMKTHALAIEKKEIENLRRYQYLADSIPQILFRLTPDASYDYFNKVWFEYTGLTKENTIGLNWKKVIHPEDLNLLMNLIKHNENLEGLECECRILNKLGDYRWHLIRVQPETDDNTHELKTWLGTATDIEDRKKREEAQRFLAEAGEILVSSLDSVVTLQSISKLAVPYFADWCAFDLINEQGKLENLITYHFDSEDNNWAKEVHESHLAFPEIQSVTKRVLESGKSEVHYSELTKHSLMIIPLIAHGQALGTLTFAASKTPKIYDQYYKDLGEELGRRVALSFENSQLYQISQQAIEVRNDFLSIASHELNTPITSLKFQLQILKKTLANTKDAPLPIEKFTKSVDTSVKQVERLINLVQVLLDVSYIQAGKFNLIFEEFNINEMFNELIERQNEIMVNFYCELKVDYPRDLKIVWDKTRIEQVFINLLNNAVKYAPGKIEILVREENEQIVIKVRDYGKGIPQEKLNFIFDRFERATSNLNVSGLGLGLYIVKQIVEGHQGKIEVDSQIDLGTCFTITLPKKAIKVENHPPLSYQSEMQH
jgi:PAS domain S-box-containing protein